MDRSKALKQLSKLKKLGDKKLVLAAEGWNKPWKCLIATMMSAQTRDTVTIVIAKKLFAKYSSPKKLAAAKPSDIHKIIRSVNYYKTKTKNILACVKMLVKDYNGKVPTETKELIKLPGVGRKTANVCLSEFGYAAIGVDTHVNQISNYLGWTKNKNPDKIEEDLLKLFPKSKWKEVNMTLVKFGQTYRSKREWKELLDTIK
jgi:endonuclease-3